MISLIIKDIFTLKKTFIFALLYVPFFMIAFQKMENAMLSAGIVGVTYILVVTACAYDEKSKADILLNSLPVNRFEIVLAKYISILLYAFIAMLEYFFIERLVMVIGIPFSISPVTFESLFGALFAVILMNSIYLPLFFKFGYVKSKIVSFVLFFVFFFGISTVVEIVKNADGNGIIKGYILKIMSQTDFLTAVQFSLFLILIFLGSILISVKFYNKREF